MNKRLLELALEKQRLVLRSDALRRRCAEAAGEWGPLFGVADRLHRGLDWLRRHPPVIAALAIGLFMARPRAVLGAAGRAWMAWRAVRRAGAGIAALAARGPSKDG